MNTSINFLCNRLVISLPRIGIGVALFGTTLFFSSCTLIGFGVGAIIDSGNDHGTDPIFTDIDHCNGKKVRIVFPGDSISYATFTGYTDEPIDQYRKAYDKYLSRHSDNTAAITLGDSVVTRNRDLSGRFTGYFPDGILLNEKKIYFKSFDQVVFPKLSDTKDMRMLCQTNAIPIRARLNFHSGENDFTLTNRDFENVYAPSYSGDAKWIGGAIGLAVDVAYVVFLAHTLTLYSGSFAQTHVNTVPLH